MFTPNKNEEAPFIKQISMFAGKLAWFLLEQELVRWHGMDRLL